MPLTRPLSNIQLSNRQPENGEYQLLSDTEDQESFAGNTRSSEESKDNTDMDSDTEQEDTANNDQKPSSTHTTSTAMISNELKSITGQLRQVDKQRRTKKASLLMAMTALSVLLALFMHFIRDPIQETMSNDENACPPDFDFSTMCGSIHSEASCGRNYILEWCKYKVFDETCEIFLYIFSILAGVTGIAAPISYFFNTSGNCGIPDPQISVPTNFESDLVLLQEAKLIDIDYTPRQRAWSKREFYGLASTCQEQLPTYSERPTAIKGFRMFIATPDAPEGLKAVESIIYDYIGHIHPRLQIDDLPAEEDSYPLTRATQ